MGASLNSGGGRRRAGRDYRQMSEINVTPFVDVMLVLLVVFMKELLKLLLLARQLLWQ